MRRYGDAPRRGIAYRDRPGAYGVILRGRHILLAEQNGDWLLPGGGIDPGESVTQALHREAFEETGWSIAPMRRIAVFSRYCWMAESQYWARKVQHVVLCKPGRKLGAPVEVDHTPFWVDAWDAVALLAVEGERVAVRAALEQGAGSVSRP